MRSVQLPALTSRAHGGGNTTRILLSYHYFKDTDLDRMMHEILGEPYPEVFADSGAFSAYTQGARILLPEYAAWLKRWQHWFSVYANLDVIGSWEQTAANQQRLEDLGLAPLPVFHTLEPFDALEALIIRYPYIALGGMVPHLQFPDRLMPWLVKAFQLARGQAVYHGFGCTNWTILKALPWYSVDSSSWTAAMRYGRVPLFDPQRGTWTAIQLGNRASCYKAAKLLRRLGFSPEDFANRTRNTRLLNATCAARAYMLCEAWLRQRHGAIEIPRAPAHSAPGIPVSLAHTGTTEFRLAQTGLRVYLADALGAGGSDLAAAQASSTQHDAAEQGGVRMYLANNVPSDWQAVTTKAEGGASRSISLTEICTSSAKPSTETVGGGKHLSQ